MWQLQNQGPGKPDSFRHWLLLPLLGLKGSPQNIGSVHPSASLEEPGNTTHSTMELVLRDLKINKCQAEYQRKIILLLLLLLL